MADEQHERLDHLREHLAALESYGNGNGQRAAAARDEIAAIETTPAPDVEGAPEASTKRKPRTRTEDA